MWHTPAKNHMKASFFLLVVCICFTLISGSEVVQDEKELYKELLSEIHLTHSLLDRSQFIGSKAIKEARRQLMDSLSRYQELLKSEKVIFYFCGSIERTEEGNPGFRMSNIYRRDTLNPFAEKINGNRMIKRRDSIFPKGISKEYFEQWHDLMDQDLVHFSNNKNYVHQDLDQVITARSVEKVKDLINEKFIEQGGVLESGKINFSKWNVEALAYIFNIDHMNYKNAFYHLDSIKFTKK